MRSPRKRPYLSEITDAFEGDDSRLVRRCKTTDASSAQIAWRFQWGRAPGAGVTSGETRLAQVTWLSWSIETIFEAMKDALCRGENIEIRGLGAFHVKNYQGYQGRNPKTGQVIPVKPKRGLLFRTGKELRDRVNRPPAQSNAAGGESGSATGTGGAP